MQDSDKNVQINIFSEEHNEDQRVCGDKQRLKQIVANICQSLIKLKSTNTVVDFEFDVRNS